MTENLINNSQLIIVSKKQGKTITISFEVMEAIVMLLGGILPHPCLWKAPKKKKKISCYGTEASVMLVGLNFTLFGWKFIDHELVISSIKTSIIL